MSKEPQRNAAGAPPAASLPGAGASSGNSTQPARPNASGSSNATQGNGSSSSQNAAGVGLSSSARSGGSALQPYQPILRSLNVKDALTYLDQVKLKFEFQPEIYNRFLDIMKDFKMQMYSYTPRAPAYRILTPSRLVDSIDTPGVIDRVSSLFRNHPSLISGFNTFLPQGFRIECQTDPKKGGIINSITVITPLGTQHLAAGSSTNLTGIKLPGQVSSQLAPQPASTSDPKSTSAQQGQSASGPAGGSTVEQESKAAAAVNERITTKGQAEKDRPSGQQPAPSLQAPMDAAVSASTAPRIAQPASSAPSQSKQVPPPHAAALAAPAPTAGTRNSTPAAASTLSENRSGRPPIEFNHAISYVNKIKNRFIRDPDIYRTFLDILQTYQKEQRPIQDVYAQVTRLFKTAPDLLDEFKQFLPDHSQAGQQAAAASASAKEAASQAMQASLSAERKKAPPAPAPAQPAASSSRLKTKPASVAADEYVPSQPAKRKRAGHADSMAIDVPAARSDVTPAPPSAKQKSARGSKRSTGPAAGIRDPPTIAQQSNARYESSSAAVNGYPQPILSYLPPGYTLPGVSAGAMPQAPPPVAQETQEERVFFSRIAEFIDDRFTYFEFLKLLNLYTQDIIDLSTLVSRAWLFIGSAPELWMDFRELVGWREGVSLGGRTIENGEWIVENVPAVERKGPDLSKCEAAGPSYRRLPKSEMQMNCSGRDQLCWEVLNDEWVSVMSLGSEEVFLAHRKNPFEEALHRTEDERHEFDFHIEANLRTIALLEPIAAKIASMDPEERMTFRLKPGLGGQSKSIYQRIVKKVYGRELGREIIQALHENPCTSVPIVLARLKQKDEEWKRALREWNRVWREVDAKNFYRSLDHQGVTFKAQDKRYISTKALVSEIETLRRTELQKRIALPRRLRPPPATYELAFPIDDENVLFDSLKLFLSYLDRAPGYHTMAERDRIEAFLRSLTSLVFAIPVSVLDSMLTPVQDHASESTSEAGEADGLSDSAASSAEPSAKRQGSLAANGASTAAAKKSADLRKTALKNAGAGDTKRSGRADGEATLATSRDSTPLVAEVQKTDSLAAASPAPSPTSAPEDVSMLDALPSTEADAQSLLEQSAGGDSSFKKDVPTSAAGLEGMQGVETVQTGVEGTYSSTAVPPVVETPQAEITLPQAAQPNPTAETSTKYVEPAAIPEPEVSPSSSQPQSPTPPGSQTHQNGTTTPILQPALPYGQPQIRRFNFFCNTPYYSAIRLLHLLYSRLHAMKETARALASTKSEGALENSSYTVYGRANPRFSGQDGAAASITYDGMLELCEKLFGSEIDQGVFEEGLRKLFGNQAYHVFTIDKVLSALVKTVWSLIDSNREAYSSNGEIFKLLVDDRRYPTTAQAQQISYRVNAELAAGSDENLYRIEWMPRRHLLSFQLLGRDEILPEDEGDLSRAWEQYIQSFLNDEVTKDLPIEVASKNVFLTRNAHPLRGKQLPQLNARSDLESRICMRSYRMFWQKGTEDEMHRDFEPEDERETLSLNEKRVRRWQAWLEKQDASDKDAEVKAHDNAAEPAAKEASPVASPATTKEELEKVAEVDAEVRVNNEEPKASSAAPVADSQPEAPHSSDSVLPNPVSTAPAPQPSDANQGAEDSEEMAKAVTEAAGSGDVDMQES